MFASLVENSPYLLIFLSSIFFPEALDFGLLEVLLFPGFAFPDYISKS